MPQIGYHISHEQFAPGHLLQLAVKAGEAGFGSCLSSDHFHPWSEAQGQSGNAWTWLGAAMALTSMRFGVVNCPSFRYHPAIIAQAAATLDEMFPGRFWIAAGSGQALNEAITGEHWPAKNERNRKLKAAVEIMRDLWRGETVSRDGPIKIEEAKLYTLPRTHIRTVAAAISPATAAWAAGWADGLITVSQPIAQLKEVIQAWRNNGGEGKPMILKIQVSYAKDRGKSAGERVRTMAHQCLRKPVAGGSAPAIAIRGSCCPCRTTGHGRARIGHRSAGSDRGTIAHLRRTGFRGTGVAQREQLAGRVHRNVRRACVATIQGMMQYQRTSSEMLTHVRCLHRSMAVHLYSTREPTPRTRTVV